MASSAQRSRDPEALPRHRLRYAAARQIDSAAGMVEGRIQAHRKILLRFYRRLLQGARIGEARYHGQLDGREYLSSSRAQSRQLRPRADRGRSLRILARMVARLAASSAYPWR